MKHLKNYWTSNKSKALKYTFCIALITILITGLYLIAIRYDFYEALDDTQGSINSAMMPKDIMQDHHKLDDLVSSSHGIESFPIPNKLRIAHLCYNIIYKFNNNLDYTLDFNNLEKLLPQNDIARLNTLVKAVMPLDFRHHYQEISAYLDREKQNFLLFTIKKVNPYEFEIRYLSKLLHDKNEQGLVEFESALEDSKILLDIESVNELYKILHTRQELREYLIVTINKGMLE